MQRRKPARQQYRPCPNSVQRMTSQLERLELASDLPPEPLSEPLPEPPQHDRLQHGMGCALCRNHYWTQGQAGQTFLS